MATRVPDGPDRSRFDALYVHIPFCFHKCHYCDFYSIVNDPEHDEPRQRAFTTRLIAELRHRAQQALLRPQTIFVGGGTPTFLRSELWQELLTAMRDLGIIGPGSAVTEFTVEANPETVTPALMQHLAEAGVNRVSLGAQSFQPALLKALERWHDPSSVDRAVGICRDAGIRNVNLDLIFAIPGQDMAMLGADLDAILGIEPTHLSCYSLIFEPHTPLHQKMRMGQVAPLGEDLERAMYQRVMERLDAAGFEHYEVSNWAQRTAQAPSAYRCQHNLHYWLNRNWLGVGPSAASHLDGLRWKNLGHLGQYIDTQPEPPVTDVEELPADARVGEALMLRLRLRDGVALDWLDANVPADHARRAVIDELVQLGMLERTATSLRLTAQGLFVADAVIGKLL